MPLLPLLPLRFRLHASINGLRPDAAVCGDAGCGTDYRSRDEVKKTRFFSSLFFFLPTCFYRRRRRPTKKNSLPPSPFPTSEPSQNPALREKAPSRRCASARSRCPSTAARQARRHLTPPSLRFWTRLTATTVTATATSQKSKGKKPTNSRSRSSQGEAPSARPCPRRRARPGRGAAPLGPAAGPAARGRRERNDNGGDPPSQRSPRLSLAPRRGRGVPPSRRLLRVPRSRRRNRSSRCGAPPGRGLPRLAPGGAARPDLDRLLAGAAAPRGGAGLPARGAQRGGPRGGARGACATTC